MLAVMAVTSDGLRGRESRGCDLATLRRILGRDVGNRGDGESDSSLDGVNGGDGGSTIGRSMTSTCRIRETEMVASAAISFAISTDRGVVVKTTK